MNLSEVKELLLKTHIGALTHGERAISTTLESMPGVGKSESVFQYAFQLAQHLGRPVGIVVCMLASISGADVRGFMIPMRGTPPKSVFSLPPWYPSNSDPTDDEDEQSINYWVVMPDGTWHREGGWHEGFPDTGIVFLDEWGQADEDVKKPSAELLLNGNVGSHRLPLGWRVVAAQNRVTDRSGVMREMMHIINRRLLVKVEMSLPTWLQWTDEQIGIRRPHFMTVAFARANPDIVFRDKVPDGTDPFCTPRTLCMMDRTLRMIRSAADEAEDRLPSDDIAREVMAGLIGSAEASQFVTYLKYFDQLPTVEEILDDPRAAKLPERQDAQMVASFMLAHHLNEDNAGPFLTYILRMIPEMQILAVQIVTADQKRAQHMYPVPQFQQFLSRHKDLMVGSYI